MTRTIRKGQIIAITQGAWSDYCLLDHVRALRDFDPIIEAERFKPEELRKDYFNDDEEYVAWLIREAIVEPLPVNEVVELHIGDYGGLSPEVRGPAEES